MPHDDAVRASQHGQAITPDRGIGYTQIMAVGPSREASGSVPSTRERALTDKRTAIDAAKAKFAAAHDMTGASNSAISKAWKRAGKPG